MSNYQPVPEGKDPVLWKIANKRASFKGHLAFYIVVNGFFWALWYFTGRNHGDEEFPWPLWSMFGWGIGLAFHFAEAYVYPKTNFVEKEYEKLKDQR